MQAAPSSEIDFTLPISMWFILFTIFQSLAIKTKSPTSTRCRDAPSWLSVFFSSVCCSCSSSPKVVSPSSVCWVFPSPSPSSVVCMSVSSPPLRSVSGMFSSSSSFWSWGVSGSWTGGAVLPVDACGILSGVGSVPGSVAFSDSSYPTMECSESELSCNSVTSLAIGSVASSWGSDILRCFLLFAHNSHSLHFTYVNVFMCDVAVAGFCCWGLLRYK